MKAMLFLVCLGVAVLEVLMWPGASSLSLAAGGPRAAQGVDPGKGELFLAAIRSRFGKPDRVTGGGRTLLHYDLPNGDTLTFVVSGAKVLDSEHKTRQPRGDLLDAIRSRLGKPDRVTGSGRAFIDYDLANGDTLTLVVSDGRVLGTGHRAKK